MLYLIELYDHAIPFNNYLMCRLLEPDELVLICDDSQRGVTAAQRQFEHFKRFFRLKTEAVILRCDTCDIARTADCMRSIIIERGEENCVLDIIGGTETLHAVTGVCMTEHPLLRVAALKNAQPVWVWGGGAFAPVGLTVRDIISLSAGELLRCGHADWRTLDEGLMALVPVVFRIYMQNRDRWPSFVFYLQRLNNLQYKLRDGVFSGPVAFVFNRATGKKVSVDTGILQELMQVGIVTDCHLTSVVCRLSFAQPDMVRFLCDTGSWLELFVFSVLHGSGLFDDIEINPVVSWDNDSDDDDTVNEVDLIAVRGVAPLFISCKSGVPTTDDINEIATITRRFGHYGAKAVLVTACDIASDAPAVGKRAADCDVSVIDAPLLNERDIRACFAALCGTLGA